MMMFNWIKFPKFDYEKITATSFIRVADRGILTALIALIIVCYGLDLFFFGSKATDWFLIPLFVLLGFGLRTLAITAGVMLESVKDQKDNKRARFTWRLIFVGSVTALMLSAVSFFVGGYERKAGKETAIETVEIATTGTVDEQVGQLREQQDRIRADRDANIATLQQSIDNITTDRLDNDDLADAYRADQAAERDSARDRVASIDKQIADLIASKGEAQTTAAETRATNKVEEASTWAVFSWLSGRTGAEERDVADFGMLYIALLLEAIVAFGPGAYYGIHRKFVAFVRKMKAMELEEAAVLDAEIADIEARATEARVRAENARKEKVSEAAGALEKAKQAEADATLELERAEIERRIQEARDRIEALKNPPPKPDLTAAQQNAQNAGMASGLANEGRNTPPAKIPAGDWCKRADRLPEFRKAG